jgi:hypothetical protein
MAVDVYRTNQTGSPVIGTSRAATAVSTEGVRATYCYASQANTPAATPTDIFKIAGSATKTIRITRIAIGGIAGTAGYLKIALVRRSTAGSGGTATNPAALKHDTSDPAATATLTLYTANPTVGTAVGTLHNARVFLPLVTATGSAPLVWDFTQRNEEGIVLRGTTDILAINGVGDTVPSSGVLDIDVTWIEE